MLTHEHNAPRPLAAERRGDPSSFLAPKHELGDRLVKNINRVVQAIRRNKLTAQCANERIAEFEEELRHLDELAKKLELSLTIDPETGLRKLDSSVTDGTVHP